MTTHSIIRSVFAFASLANFSYAQLVIPSGTKVSTRLEQTLSSSTAQEGQAVNLSVTEDVRINDVVVIRQGATVFGTVSMAQEKRRMGRSGKLDFTIEKVRAADGEFIPLRYTPFKKQGEGKSVTTGVLTAGAAVVFWPAAPLFLLLKGKDATINKGITVDVFTDADHTLKSPTYRNAPAVTSVAPGAPVPAIQMASSPANPFAGGGELVPVMIEADRDSAEIEIDGSFVGNVPTTRGLAPGNHTVTVRDGAAVWQRTITVQPGDSLRLRANLAAAQPASRTTRR
jgi:hypothetical protein